MALLIPIKKNGFIFFLRFHCHEADSGMLQADLALYGKPARKRPVSIGTYDVAAACKQQSGIGWNWSSLQLKSESSYGLDCYIQKIDAGTSVVPGHRWIGLRR